MYNFLRKYKDLENHRLNGQLTCLERLEERSLLVKFYDDVEKFENYSLINFCPIKQQYFNYKKFNDEKIFEKNFENSELNFNTLFLTQFVPFRYINSDMDFGENLLKTFFRVKRLNFIAKCYRKRFLQMTEEIRVEGNLRFFEKLPPYFYNWHIKRLFYLYFNKNIFIKNCIKKFYINFLDAIFFQVTIKSFQKSLVLKEKKIFFLKNIFKKVNDKIIFFLNENFLKKKFWRKNRFLKNIATKISRKCLWETSSTTGLSVGTILCVIDLYLKNTLKLQMLGYLWKTKRSWKIFKMLIFRQKIFFLKKSFMRNKLAKYKVLKKKFIIRQLFKNKNSNYHYFLTRKFTPSRRRIREITDLLKAGLLPPEITKKLEWFPKSIQQKRRLIKRPLTKRQKYWLKKKLKRKRNKTPWIKEFVNFDNRRCCLLLNSNKFFTKTLFVKEKFSKWKRRRRKYLRFYKKYTKFKRKPDLKEIGPCYIMVPSKLPRATPFTKARFYQKHLKIMQMILSKLPCVIPFSKTRLYKKYLKIKNQIKI